MRVLIIGAGVVGSIYGTHLVLAGHDVAVLAHDQRTQRIARHGLITRQLPAGRTRVARVDVVESAAGTTYDLVLVAVTYDQLTSVIPALNDLTGTPAVLYLGNNPAGRSGLPYDLSAAISLGFPGVAGILVDDVVEYAKVPHQPTLLEAGVSRALDEFDQATRRAGLPTRRMSDMDGWLAWHAVLIGSIGAALRRCGNDLERLAKDYLTLRLLCQGLTEGFACLRHQRVGGRPEALVALHRAPLRPVAEMYWARAFRSPMARFWFATKEESAQQELQSLGEAAAARVGDLRRAEHLHALLGC